MVPGFLSIFSQSICLPGSKLFRPYYYLLRCYGELWVGMRELYNIAPKEDRMEKQSCLSERALG
jgi:hypothetical protein